MLLTARYVLPVATPHIEYGAVLIRDDKIVEIGDFEHLRALHPDEPVRDFGLAALMPGFVDLHTHLEYSAMRGLVDDLPYSEWKLQLMQKERQFTSQDWDDSALLGALEAAQSGITTVADITRTGASGHAAQATGIRALIYREVATMDKSQVEPVMQRAAEDIAAWRATSDPGRVTIGIAPHAPYSCHPALFKRVASFAADGTPVAIHLAGSVEEYEFVKYGSSMLATDVRDTYDADAPGWLPTGVSPVRYVLQWGLFDVPNILAVHCTQVNDDDIEVLAGRDVSIAHCPRCEAKLGMGVAPIEKFLRAGIRVGLGTDSPAASNSMDVFEEMRIGLLVQRATLGEERFMNARQFVKMATLDAARALKMDHVDRLARAGQAGRHHRGRPVDLAPDSDAPSLQHARPYREPGERVGDHGGGRVHLREPRVAPLDHQRIYARAEEMRMQLRG